MATHSPEQILVIWEQLSLAEQRRLVVEHLRDTHSSNPLYKEKADRDARGGNPMEFWERFSSSCATMIPDTWVTRYNASCTPADLYRIRAARKLQAEQ